MHVSLLTKKSKGKQVRERMLLTVPIKIKTQNNSKQLKLYEFCVPPIVKGILEEATLSANLGLQLT